MKNYLTTVEIEELAEGLIHQFHKGCGEGPRFVDIDAFTSNFLKLNVEYHTFAEEDSGKVGFISDGRTPLWVHRNGVNQVLFPRGTIVVEKYLLHPREENRRRFTIAHEDAHFLLDRAVSAASFHREYDNERTYTLQELRNLFSFRENQMDRLGAALLMPRFMVQNIVDEYTLGDPIAIYGHNLLSVEDKLLVQSMADAMRVSYTAFLIRLKELDLYERHDREEYIIQQMHLGSDVVQQ